MNRYKYIESFPMWRPGHRSHIKKAAEKPEVFAPLAKRNSKMFKCEECKHDFEREANFNFHKDALCDNYYDYFCAVEDIEPKFRCEICETKFETERDLNEHELAVWCDECFTFWNCKYHNQRSECTNCDEKLSCKVRYIAHWHDKHEENLNPILSNISEVEHKK